MYDKDDLASYTAIRINHGRLRNGCTCGYGSMNAMMLDTSVTSPSNNWKIEKITLNEAAWKTSVVQAVLELDPHTLSLNGTSTLYPKLFLESV
jgi:hypothetical protein